MSEAGKADGAVSVLGVVGAGTMGAGIAQLAALGGISVRLHDPDAAALTKGSEALAAGLKKGGQSGRWTKERAETAGGLVTTASSLNDLKGCDAVIEAAPERLDLKRSLFEDLAEVCGGDALLATNTSSLSVSAIAASTPESGRVVGMHFFNPPVLMKLVEVIAGDDSSAEAIDRAVALAEQMDRSPVRAKDAIGFIANRCARPYTLEGLRLLGEGAGTAAEIDRVCRIGGGFKMGPFELMDLVGIDVNFAVAISFFEQSFGEPRWRPHPLHARQAASGRLGRKTGAGFYDYSGDGPHRPADPDSTAARPMFDDPYVLAKLAGENAPRILERIAAAIANEACFALGEQVGSKADIDKAMRLGFNWPLGPFEWGDALGWDRALDVLENLREERGEAYRPAPLLRQMASGGSPGAPAG